MKLVNLQLVTVLLFILLSFYTLSIFAEDITFEIAVDQSKISVGSSVKLSLNFYGIKDALSIELPDIDGFDTRYMGPSTRMSIINGKVSSSIAHAYRLIPLRVGKFTIPSFSVKYKGKTYRSEAIQIEVVPDLSSQYAQKDSSTIQKYQGLGDRAFVIMEVAKDTVYVNEIIQVSIKFYINQLTVRDIKYPEFNHQGFFVDKFSELKQYREIVSGTIYDVIEFNTNIFAVRPGEFEVGPAIVNCNILESVRSSKRRRSSFFDDDFFGSGVVDSFFNRGYRKRPLSLASSVASIKVNPLPGLDVPKSYNGALGDYDFYLEAEPREVKVGDPITLKMTISGQGNFNTVQAPDLDIGDNFKVYDPEVSQNVSSKIFSQVIIPKDVNIRKIPKVSFSFFDTGKKEYKEIARGPIDIKVTALLKGEELKIFDTPQGTQSFLQRKEVLGRDIIYIKDSPGVFRKKGEMLCKNKLFLFLQLIPLLAVVWSFFFQRRKERLAIDIGYARRLRAPAKARKNLRITRKLLDSKSPDRFFDSVFKTLQAYLGDKFHLSTAGITSDVVYDLRSRGLDEDILNKLSQCFNYCDRARYAPASIGKEEMKNVYALLEEVIDKLSKIKL